MGVSKNRSWGYTEILGKWTYPEKCLSLQDTRINFHYRTLPRIFDVRLKFAYAFITWLQCISCDCTYAWNL
jgi:hypothetical protein